MAKIIDARNPAPDMSGYVSPRVQKGVRYLDGAEGVKLKARVKKAFSKAKVPVAS